MNNCASPCQASRSPWADGIEALYQLDSELPDLVVLDLGLPRLSGRDVQQDIFANPRTRHIPILVVTGDPGSRSVRESAVEQWQKDALLALEKAAYLPQLREMVMRLCAPYWWSLGSQGNVRYITIQTQRLRCQPKPCPLLAISDPKTAGSKICCRRFFRWDRKR
jgi:CheY-like chemotaxis protein